MEAMPLKCIGIHIKQSLIGRLILDAFSNDFEAHGFANRDQGFGQRVIDRINDQGMGERAVDLDAINMQTLEQVERVIPGADIIEPNAETALVQLLNQTYLGSADL